MFVSDDYQIQRGLYGSNGISPASDVLSVARGWPLYSCRHPRHTVYSIGVRVLHFIYRLIDPSVTFAVVSSGAPHPSRDEGTTTTTDDERAADASRDTRTAPPPRWRRFESSSGQGGQRDIDSRQHTRRSPQLIRCRKQGAMPGIMVYRCALSLDLYSSPRSPSLTPWDGRHRARTAQQMPAEIHTADAAPPKDSADGRAASIAHVPS